MYGQDDPKFATSGTEARAELAAQRIPGFVEKLEFELRSRGLSRRDVELLYGEYRAFYSSRRPFRSSIDRCQPNCTHLFDDWSPTQLLGFLQAPTEIGTREEALGALYSLWAEVTVETRKGVYALT